MFFLDRGVDRDALDVVCVDGVTLEFCMNGLFEQFLVAGFAKLV